MPALTGILETALYVDDLERAKQFYKSVFPVEELASDDRFCALAVARRQVLLLFARGATAQPIALPGGAIPPHGGAGRSHMAFSIAGADLDAWEAELTGKRISIEGRAAWPGGGRSIFFRDPDGNLLELATPGTWPIY
jgi:catechol 2,3-dioxygenase-like lactoylglutathione lyase family enzyme